jgi:hypothetical protein
MVVTITFNNNKKSYSIEDTILGQDHISKQHIWSNGKINKLLVCQ